MPQHIEYLYDVDPKKQGFFWPASEQKRIDYFAVKRLRPAEAESVYQCRPGARTGSIFVETDFRYCQIPNGIEMGMRSPAIRAWVERSGGIIAQGWDTAITATSQSDYTACITVLLVPCYEYHRGEIAELVGPGQLASRRNVLRFGALAAVTAGVAACATTTTTTTVSGTASGTARS